MTPSPLGVAIIGMDGFARDHHRSILKLERDGLCRLLCSCDPRMEAYADLQAKWQFETRNVTAFTDYREMLERFHGALDVVTIPTPIPLHAPMHRACLEHELACYLEKPPTLDAAELDRMLEVEEGAGKQTQVGFSFIVEPARQALKRRLVSGEFGRVRRVTFRGLSSRADAYYARTAWAGRLMLDGAYVLDSCLGNAMAHYLHNLHFWAGQDDLFAWEGVERLEAELYRGHEIEGMDTVFAHGVSPSGVEFLIAATHACPSGNDLVERAECDRATLSYQAGKGYGIDWNDGRKESIGPVYDDLLTQNLAAYFRYLRGEVARPLTRLIDSRPFVQSYGLCYAAAKQIATVPASYLVPDALSGKPDEYAAIQGIGEVTEAFLETGQFPSAQGIAWARPGGKAALADLGSLHATVRAMCAQVRREKQDR